MSDLISRQAVIAKFEPWLKVDGYSEGELNTLKAVLFELTVMPPAVSSSRSHENDLIGRQAAIDEVSKYASIWMEYDGGMTQEEVAEAALKAAKRTMVHILEELPSAQPEQRYTEEELRVFAHGISLSLLSKRSAQHWQYDEDTATEIKFLERLYDKVVADMGDEQDDKQASTRRYEGEMDDPWWEEGEANESD